MSFGRIIVSKNGTIITPYRKRQSRSLEYMTSQYDHVYHKAQELTGFQIPNFQGQTAFITHSLPKDQLHQFLDTYDYEKLPETPAKPILSGFSLNPDITLRDYQGDIASQIIMSANKYSEWFINLQTGLGKTLLGIYLASHFKRKTMVICFLTDILKQWQNACVDKTTMDLDRILTIDSRATLDAIYHNDFDPDQYDMYLVSPSLLTNYMNFRDYSWMTDIFAHLGIGLLIFDEGHHNMGTIVKINAVTNVKYTLYLSADFAQGDSQKEVKYYKIFSHAMVVKPNEQVEKDMKHTNVIVVDYDTHPSQNDIALIYNKYGYSAEIYMKYEMGKKRIFDVIKHLLDLIDKARKDEHKTLILFTNIWAVDEMYKWLTDNYQSYRFLFGRYHSKMDDEEKMNTLEFANVIIATYSSFGTGRDLDNIKYVIGTNQSNKVEDNQAAGRSRPLKDGSSSVYFIVTDTGFGYCRKKLKIRLGYLRKTKMIGEPTVYHM